MRKPANALLVWGVCLWVGQVPSWVNLVLEHMLAVQLPGSWHSAAFAFMLFCTLALPPWVLLYLDFGRAQ